MYNVLPDPLSPNFGRMYVNKGALDAGPPRENDTVTIGVAEGVEFYVLVHSVAGDSLTGEVIAIGPNPREEYAGWARGDYIMVSESAVRAIIRVD